METKQCRYGLRSTNRGNNGQQPQSTGTVKKKRRTKMEEKVNPERSCDVCIDEALVHIFQFLDVPRLKICRLVSKKWNLEASFCMRQRSLAVMAKIRYNYLLKTLRKGRELGLPTPLQNFITLHQKEDPIPEPVDPTLSRVVKEETQTDLKITGLRTPLPKSSILLDMLTNHGSTLSVITLVNHSLEEFSHENYHPEYLKPLKLTALESFHCDIYRLHPGWLDLVIDIINSAPKLKTLQVTYKCAKAKPLNKLLTEANLSRVEKLVFAIRLKVSTSVLWNSFNSVSLPKLKHLHMSFWRKSCIENIESGRMFGFLHKLDSTLEHLHLYIKSETGLNVIDHGLIYALPNLKSLSVRAAPVTFSTRYFKKLKKIRVEEFISEEQEEEVDRVEPYLQVERVDCGHSFHGQQEFLESGILTVSMKFPNARIWDLEIGVLTKFIHCLPDNIERLRIYRRRFELPLEYHHVSSEFNLFPLVTGLGPAVHEQLKADPDSEILEDPDERLPSLLDYTGITQIIMDVAPGEVDHLIVKFGFARMQQLNLLAFHSDVSTNCYCQSTAQNSELFLKAIGDHLQKIDRVIIMGCCKCFTKYKTQMYNLFTKMPNLECGCKGVMSSNNWVSRISDGNDV